MPTPGDDGSGHEICFPPFRLDVENQQLNRDGLEVALRPKALAVLTYLATRPRKLVGKRELLDAVWPGTFVSDTVVKVCVREIRKALGDDSNAARYVETVARRGYRFVAEVAAGSGTGALPMVGRLRELGHLDSLLGQARSGRRRLAFVTGEPGIGKTTLVRAFLERLGHHGELLVASGQCLEFFGSGEAYMPVLEVLNRLCRSSRGSHVVELLRSQAPSWLVQMPWWVDEAEQAELRRRTLGLGAARMLREMVEALEALASRTPLVIVLEDLHWSDGSTLDLLSALLRRPEPARLMVLGTFRPTELDSDHPLGSLLQDLRLHQLCEELELAPMTLAEVEEYLTGALGRVLPGLAELIQLRTEGHPLFVIQLTDHLTSLLEADREQSLTRVLESGEFVVPENLRQMIEGLLRRLSADEQRLLEAASVAGVRFSAASVAGALGKDVAEVEALAEELVRHGRFLRGVGVVEWPDGTLAGRYEFLHTLYRSVLYIRLAETPRIRYHQRIGTRMAAGFENLGHDVAGELAMHFERGRLGEQAVTCREQAARTAIQRGAYREAISHLARALALIDTLPENAEARRRAGALESLRRELTEGLETAGAREARRLL